MKVFKFRKSLIATLTTTLFFSAEGYAVLGAEPAFKYERVADFIKPINVTEAVSTENVFNLSSGSITLRFSSHDWKFASLFAVTNKKLRISI